MPPKSMTSSTPSIWIHLPDEKLLINANRWFVPSAQHNTVDWNVRIDGDGRAVPYIANAEDLNTGDAYVNYLTGSGSYESWSGSVKKVPAREIEIRFEGMEEFSVQADD